MKGFGRIQKRLRWDPLLPLRPPTPPLPAGFSATASGPTSVFLDWDDRSGISRYKVERRTGSTGSWSTVSEYVYTSSRTVPGLTCDTTYYFKVSAYGNGTTYGAEWGSPTSPRSATPECVETPPPTVTPTTLDPPTNLTLTRYGPTPIHVSVAYSQSSGSIHYYQIELHSAATENGTYVLQATSNDATTSPAIFQYQPTGSWFTARGRNCSTDARAECSGWSDWSPAIPPPPYILIYQLVSSIETGQSVPVSGWAFNLNTSTNYSIRVTTDGGGIGFSSDCTDNQEDIPVPARSSYYNFDVVPSLYGCETTDGTVNAVLLDGSTSIAAATPEDIAVTPPAMIVVDLQNPFTGQSVTMTATPPTSRGAVSSYRWQEFSAGQWSEPDLGDLKSVRYFRSEWQEDL